jgi:hypothetical protein
LEHPRRFLLIVAALTAGLSAQPTVVYPGGSATAGGGNAVPFASTFQTDIRYQLAVPASTLPTQPSLLTAVAFTSASTSTVTIPSLTLSVGHLAPIGFSCNLDANSNDFTVQYQGAHTYNYTASTWSPFGVPLSFPYNGVDGLVLELRMQGIMGGTSFSTADAGTVLRVYNRLAGGHNATTCSHAVSAGIRLELTFSSPNVPQVNPYGQGCAGSNGIPTLGSTQLPSLGNPNFTLDIAQGASSSSAFLFAALAPANPPVVVGGCSILLDVTSLTQLISIGFSPFGPVPTGAAGTAVFPLPVPPGVQYLGATLYFQGAVTDLTTTNGFTLTNAVEVVIN